jgi:single-stranded DNA-binding protein
MVERGVTGGEDERADFFTVTVWGYSGQPCNNQQSYGQINVTVGFSRSERSRTDLGRSSNCDRRLFYDSGEWSG